MFLSGRKRQQAPGTDAPGEDTRITFGRRGSPEPVVTKPRLSDLPTAISAAVWVLAARFILYRRGFPGAIRRYGLQQADDVAPSAPPLTVAAKRAALVTEHVVRLRVLGATCLPRSIAMARVVARHGARADIVLGVTQLAGFRAHAWVEAGGERLDPAHYPESVYQTAARFTLSLP